MSAVGICQAESLVESPCDAVEFKVQFCHLALLCHVEAVESLDRVLSTADEVEVPLPENVGAVPNVDAEGFDASVIATRDTLDVFFLGGSKRAAELLGDS